MTIRTTIRTFQAELVVKQEQATYLLLWEEPQTGFQVPAFCGVGSTYFSSEIAAIGFGERMWGLIARRAS